MKSKTGITYKSASGEPSQILPTKYGYVQIVVVNRERDLSWVAVNNVSSKQEVK